MTLFENFDFTQSNLQDYVDCPYRFYMRYILRVDWPALYVNDALEFEEHLQSGARFHRLIQQYLLGVPKARINEITAEDSNSELQAWWQGFLAHVPPWINDGESWVETTLTTTLSGHRLVAKYDLLLLLPKDESLLIFDWKTAQKVPRKEWLLEKIQTRFYRLVLTQAGSVLIDNKNITPEDITMCYWFASQPKTKVELPYRQSDYQKDLTYFTSLIDTITTSEPGSFERTADLKKCRFCVYRSHCNRGVEAGALADFGDYVFEVGDLTTELAFEDLPEIEF